MGKKKKLRSAKVPHKGKEFDGLIFSIRRVKARDFMVFAMKMQQKRARYFRFKIKRRGFRFYTVLMAYK